MFFYLITLNLRFLKRGMPPRETLRKVTFYAQAMQCGSMEISASCVKLCSEWSGGLLYNVVLARPRLPKFMRVIRTQKLEDSSRINDGSSLSKSKDNGMITDLLSRMRDKINPRRIVELRRSQRELKKSEKSQREGLDYFDTYSPVTRITSTRMVLAIAALRNLEVHLMDVKPTFLNGDLEEEIYMNQPQGFIAPGLESKVCRLVKSLYDLRKAPKQGHQISPYHVEPVYVQNRVSVNEISSLKEGKLEWRKMVKCQLRARLASMSGPLNVVLWETDGESVLREACPTQMGEAAVPCMMRLNSQPLFASSEIKEGDPIRALTTSISFGRFLTEPLNWERWSSFSHNRTLEDVQKYSRPGVVAEKKAFFEAHYKNFALKKTAKLHEKENQAPPNYSPQINVITNISPVAISKTDSVVDDTRGIELANRLSEQGIASKVDVHAPSTISPVNSDDIISSTIQVCDFENNVPSTSQVEKVKMSTGNVDFEDHQFQVKVSNRSSLVDKIKKRHIKDAASDPVKLSGQIKHEVTSAKSPSRNEPYKKLQSPRKAPLTPTVHPKKAAGVVTDKKRSVLQSLHMSMNFPAARNKDVASKTTSKPNDRLTQQALTRVSVIGLKENSQVLPRPEHARSKTPSERLVNGSRTVTPKSHSTNHSDTLSPCTKKPRSPTVPSSFSFRSDERAAKRKEASPELDFFKKIEEKGNTNDTKKIQFQPKLK
ncbi:WVD2-like protein 7 isoform X1, partial [Tanacetum coccineum]